MNEQGANAGSTINDRGRQDGETHNRVQRHYMVGRVDGDGTHTRRLRDIIERACERGEVETYYTGTECNSYNACESE